MSERFDSLGRVSLIVPTLNASWDLPRLLYRLGEQTYKPDELIVVDSSSEDDTAHVARAFGAKVAVIDRANFDHGITRHAALLASSGDIVCFMTQDAVPASETCLEELLRPFEDPGVGCSTGRQLPKPGARRFEQLVREFNYGPRSTVRSERDVGVMGIKAFFVSDVCAAYRRTAFLECGGFPETDMSEDMYMAAKMIKSGWKVAYAADAAVYHSHDLTPQQQYLRNRSVGRFLARNEELLHGVSELGEGSRLALTVAGRLATEGEVLELAAFLVDCAARFAGNRAGRVVGRETARG